ncbi:hypothetical protein [Synoicihabitans lomoniglobus]|uniref:Replication modulator SeqA C-terminal DNA-binding domain-containing protein n=1 Tax=Synoicihabitans lomoniglobus TaxID=2909285 RepID=A0AAF0CI89_9BACT|nr:replication initiation negative regulator SeqA [Opitutaceae bacterium LMO-M01]WED65117.1 hypothetical protein PXH66_22495 [Opitutaceae bacterium LMO-M01]
MAPKIELTPELLAELERRRDSEHPTVEAVISSLLATSGGRLIGDPYYSFTCSAAFRSLTNDSDRYLALLAKLHAMHRGEFAEFVQGQSFKRRYFGLSAAEVCEASRHNQARQIPDSKYWAIMNIDTPTKRRFLKRLLIFIGYPDEMVTHVRGLIGNG